MAHPLDKYIPKTPIFNALRKKMPFGFGVGDDAENIYPKGVQTPFWVYSEMGNENELFPIVGDAEFSHDLAHWFNPTDGKIPISAGHQIFIRWKGTGAKVKLGIVPFPFSVGGNLFSLTRTKWDEFTECEVSEFQQYFENQINLIHSKYCLLPLKLNDNSLMQLFDDCKNLEDVPPIFAEVPMRSAGAMFRNCSKIKEIYCNFKDWTPMTDFTLSVAKSGVFYKRESSPIPFGKDGIPLGWEVVDVDVNHLDNATPFWVKNLSKDDTNALVFEGTLQYSWDAVNWNDLSGQSGTLQPQQKIFIRTKPQSGSKVKITASTQPFEVGGNLFSLARDIWDESTVYTASEFKGLFYTIQNLKCIDKLIFAKGGDSDSLASFVNTSGDMDCDIIINDDNVPSSKYRAFAIATKIRKVFINVKKIADKSFEFAFLSCNKLNEIHLYCDSIVKDAFLNWVKGVSEKGTFYKYDDVEIPIGVNGIPRGWKVVNVKREEPKPFNPNPYGNATPFWIKNLGLGENEITLSGEYQYSRDGEGWNDGKTPRLTLKENERVFIRTKPNGYSSVKILSAWRDYEVGGNLFSLTRDEWDENTQTIETNGVGEFEKYFANQINLIHSKNLILSAFTDARAYNQLFIDCVNMVDCAKIVAKECQSATYSSFLSGCAKVGEIYCNIVTWQQYTDFSKDVASNGTFHKRASAQIPTGKDGIPTGWSVVTITD